MLQRKKELGRPDLTLLSVYRDYGVINKDSRDDNYNRAGADLAAYQVVRPGDVVANKMKTWQGSIAVSDLEGLVSPAYIVCSVDRDVHSRFLHYLLRSRPYIAQYKRLSHGVRPAQWDLRWADLRKVRLELPPAAAQVSIADFLDRETGRIDALVEKKRRLIELLEDKRTALISHVVTKGLDPTVPMKHSAIPWLGEIPAHWEVVQLRRAVERFVDYRGKTPEKVDEGVVLITARNIRDGSIDLAASVEYIREEDYATWMVRGFPEIGDVLLTTEAPLGQVAQIEDDSVALAQRVILMKPHGHVMRRFLAYNLRSVSTQAEMWSRATGSTAPGIKADRLRGVLVALPPPGEQHEIVEHLDVSLTKLRSLRERLAAQLDLLAEYRQALITAAVTGQIDVGKHPVRP